MCATGCPIGDFGCLISTGSCFVARLTQMKQVDVQTAASSPINRFAFIQVCLFTAKNSPSHGMT